MARGFLSGVLWGGLFGVGAAGVASVFGPPPQSPQIADAAPDAVTTPDRIETASNGATGAALDSAPVADTTAQIVPAPQADTTPDLAQADTVAPARPTAPATSDLTAPQEGTQTASVEVGGDDQVTVAPQAPAPVAPAAPDQAQIDTTPAAAPRPAPVEAPARADDTTVAEASENADPQTAQNGEAEVSSAQTPERARETWSETSPETDSQAAINGVTDAEPGTTQRATSETEQPQDEAAAQDAREQPVANLPEAEGATEAQDPTQEPAQTARVQTPVIRTAPDSEAGTLVARDTGVTIRRPATAAPPADAVDGTETPVAGDSQGGGTAAAQNETNTDDPRPISRFAAEFEPEGDKPLMSIVLIDDGSSAVSGDAGLAALRGFPYALSFAVDSRLPDAVSRMALYRAAGFEVLAMIDLPQGAQPSDAETTFGAILPEMGEVVGVIEGTGGGFQGDREVGDQITSILLQSGHGLLTQNRGLNTLPKLARKEGVPADPVFRDFDSKGQTAAVIRRFLDQAAFKAGIEGSIVMLGRMRPDTVSALLLWGLQDRASQVSLAPISAVLLRAE